MAGDWNGPRKATLHTAKNPHPADGYHLHVRTLHQVRHAGRIKTLIKPRAFPRQCHRKRRGRR